MVGQLENQKKYHHNILQGTSISMGRQDEILMKIKHKILKTQISIYTFLFHCRFWGTEGTATDFQPYYGH